VLILSHDVFNERMRVVIAAALTSQEPRFGFPLAFETRVPGLAKRSWVLIHQLRTLSVERLGRRLARLPDESVARIVDGLTEIIG
jgi:mRNA interferase MazF